MKINVISLNNGHSLTEDAQTLAYSLKKLYRKKKILFTYYQFRETIAKVADINIFLGIVNYSLFKYAPINILIIDPHKFHKLWTPCFKKMDYVLVKTQYSYDIVSQITDKEKIFNIGWKNKDYLDTSVTKDYNSFLAIMGHSSFRQVEKLLSKWKEDYPKLTILCGTNYFENKEMEKKKQDNIEYIDKYLHIDDFVKLINQKGIHFCLGSATSFANTLHLCQTVKSIPVTLDCILYKNYVSNLDGFLVKTKKKKTLKYTMGSEYSINEEDLEKVIEKIIKIQKEDEILLEEMTEKCKKNIREDEMAFDKNLKDFFDKVWEKHNSIKELKKDLEIYEDELPTVSIITPTYNKRKFFKLSIRNFQKADYPQDKIEWIIIDDGEEEIKDLIPEQDNIKYIKLSQEEIKEYINVNEITQNEITQNEINENVNDTEEKEKITKKKLSIGAKRNIACEKAKGEYIVCMDDDDYYTPQSVKFRVASMIHLNKNVVGCSGLGLLEINKIISNVNLSSYSVGYEFRIFEHTMGFKKSHWENNKFLDTSLGEGRNLIDKDINDYEDIHWEQIGISFKHYNNTNSRMTISGQTNGSHFNINDEVFELVTNIEESAEEDKEMIVKHKKELEDKKNEYIKKDKELEEKLDSESFLENQTK
mgnify:FL=1